MRCSRPALLSGASLLLPLSLSGLTAAQDAPAAGFEVQPLAAPIPGTLWTSATFANGDVLVCDGSTVDRYDESGIFLAQLATFPAFVFPSFVRIAPDESHAVVGESTHGAILRIDLGGAGATPLATLAFNFDAVHLDADTLLVSAAASGFGLGNELWTIEVGTATAVQVGSVPGASGPLALGADGDVFYATVSDQFPPPALQTDVLVWDASLIGGGTLFDETDATVFAAGFEGGGALQVHPVTGAVYLAENDFNAGTARILSIPFAGARPQVLLEGRPNHTLTGLELVPGTGPAAFLPYQPEAGGALRYRTTDFASDIERLAVHPERPRLTVSGPGTSGPGPFDAVVTGGPPNGLAVLAYGPTALFDPQETAFVVQGVPLFLGLDLPTLTLLPNVLSLDAGGSLQQGFVNSGALSGFTAQLVLLNADGTVAGTTTAASL